MNTLTRLPTRDGNICYRINSPAFAGALTRSGGEPSDSLYARLCLAVGDVADVDIRRGRSGKWYVQPVLS